MSYNYINDLIGALKGLLHGCLQVSISTEINNGLPILLMCIEITCISINKILTTLPRLRFITQTEFLMSYLNSFGNKLK